MSNMLFRLHCPHCGNRISESDIYCPHCGTNLDMPLEKKELEALARLYLEKAQKMLDNGRNLKKALADCEQALEYAPESAEAHNLRGLILDVLGRTVDAIQAYQKAIRRRPDFKDAKANLEDALFEYRNIQQKNMNGWATQQRKIDYIFVIVAAIIGFILFCLLGLEFYISLSGRS
jgi:tetratricopeptide (TPR) repeat protein